MSQTKILQEIATIDKWLKDNDWKVNKIVIGEWQVSDERWIDYLNNRFDKRKRRDELVEELKLMNEKKGENIYETTPI